MKGSQILHHSIAQTTKFFFLRFSKHSSGHKTGALSQPEKDRSTTSRTYKATMCGSMVPFFVAA